MFKTNNRPKGNYIETQASAYLIRKGYQILARNCGNRHLWHFLRGKHVKTCPAFCREDGECA